MKSRHLGLEPVLKEVWLSAWWLLSWTPPRKTTAKTEFLTRTSGHFFNEQRFVKKMCSVSESTVSPPVVFQGLPVPDLDYNQGGGSESLSLSPKQDTKILSLSSSSDQYDLHFL